MVLHLPRMRSPIQHFWEAILEAGRCRATSELCTRKGFRERAIAGLSGHCATSFFLLLSGGCRIRCCFAASCVVALRTNSYLVNPKKKMGMPLCVLGNTRSLPHCWSCECSWWPRCLLWHGWLSLRDSSQGDLSLGRCFFRTRLMLLFRPLLVPTLFCLVVNGSHTGVRRTSLTLQLMCLVTLASGRTAVGVALGRGPPSKTLWSTDLDSSHRLDGPIIDSVEVISCQSWAVYDYARVHGDSRGEGRPS